MNTRLKVLGGAVAIASIFALTGCSSGDGGQDADGGSLSAEAAAAAKVVEAVSAPVDEFTAPGPEVTGAKDFAGKTVYYIPAILQVPLFKIQEAGVKAAFGAVGAQVQTCDAKSNPQDLATCLDQAVSANAAAVVVGSQPVAASPTAFQAVVDAGIPLVVTLVGDTALPGDAEVFSDTKKVGYVTQNGIEMQAWNANAVIADSNAEATVLVVHVTDNPVTSSWTQIGALGAYKDGCTKCEVLEIETSNGVIDKLPTAISAELTKNPNIKYIQVPFDGFVQPIRDGINAAGRDDVKIVSGDSYLDVLQSMKDGGNVVADSGYNVFATGWYAADQVFRIASGQGAVEKEAFPFRRMFTPENVGSLDLTPEGQESGSWYGKADYIGGFSKLWGLK